MLYDGLPAELPRATLRPTSGQARLIGGQLWQWLAGRWAWLRPRTVPMIAAFVGLLAVMGATKYLPVYSSRHGAPAVHRIRVRSHVPSPCGHSPTLSGDRTGCDASSSELGPGRPGEISGR